MRGGVARVTCALAVALWAGATAAQAQISQIAVDDLRLVEQSGGLYTRSVAVHLLNGFPTAADVTVNFTLVSGSATVGSDFTAQSGTLLFRRLMDDTQYINVEINGDTLDEWSPTLQQDEIFFIQLSNPSANATLTKGRGTITLVDDDHVQPGVQYLSAVTDSTGTAATDGRNRLQWRVPAAPTAPTQIKVCWKSSSTTCTSPLSDTDTDPGGCSSINGPFTAGGKLLFTHDNTSVIKVQVPRAYCYSVFTLYPSFSAERAEIAVKTFDSTPGPVKWTLTPGHYGGAAAASVVPPTVGLDGVFSVGTDGVVYAMQRGITATSGLWPPTWNPVALGKPAHNRSPVVTLPAGARFFVGTENGEVHAIDAKSGAIAWSRAAGFPLGSQQLMTGSTGTQAVPAGLFKAFGGLNDLLLVGTATAVGNTQFFALDPATGGTIDYYPNGPVGPSDSPVPGPIDNVFGMATVDYTTNRVFFGTAGSAFTLWSLDLGPGGAPDLKLTSVAWNPKPLGITGGTTGSPVARNGRLYIGTDSGAASAIHSLRISDGNLYSYTHGDGQVKGFVWPDRRDDRLYFSTVNQVQGVRDNGTAITSLWSPITVQSPSIPLQKPGSDYLYVGDGQGRLLEIDIVTGTVIMPLQLDTGSVQIGAPSLDGANDLLHVGSDKGVIYAVHVPY